jgi:hypothetical protein
MAQLQEAATRPLFGEIKEVVMNSYIEQVDKCDPRVCVVVHIYCETRKVRNSNTVVSLTLALRFSPATSIQLP